MIGWYFRVVPLMALVSMAVAPVCAEPVEVVDVAFKQVGKSWEVRVRLHHEDEGWDHYADGWRILSESGEVLANGALREPNLGPASYMITLPTVMLPSFHRVVIVEAHESRLGWSPHRVRVDLAKSEGPRYRVFQRY